VQVRSGPSIRDERIDYLPRCQRVVTGNCPSHIEQNFRHREALLLVLKGFGGQPIVHLLLATAEPAPRMVLPRALEEKAVRKPDAVHDSPRITEPRRR
jgi:hypothetical protein